MSSVCHFSYVLVKKNLECPRARWDNCKSDGKQLADSANNFETCALCPLQLLKHNSDTVAIRLDILINLPYKPCFM
jgi:hypothetical protein